MGLSVINSGFMNAIMQPNKWQTYDGKEKTLEYYWNDWKEAYVGREANSPDVRMNNIGEVEGVKDPRTRDRLQDPVHRANIASQVICQDMSQAFHYLQTTQFKQIDDDFKKQFPEDKENTDSPKEDI